MKCLWKGCGLEPKDLKQHIEEHANGNLGYACKWDGCSKQDELMCKSTFNTHVKAHFENRPFKCNKCEKSFTRTDALNKHLKRHEAGDKIIQKFVDKLFYLSELRDNEELITVELLRERQFGVNCHRILHSFIDAKESDSWDDY